MIPRSRPRPAPRRVLRSRALNPLAQSRALDRRVRSRALRRIPGLAMSAALIAAPASGSRAATLSFAGLEWDVKDGEGLGPGPNSWSESNAWVDPGGGLHLRISRQGNGWSCAEVTSRRRFRFGRFQFQVSGPIDRLDRNVVLGLFTYPADGPDGTNEIDIEFSRWGAAGGPAGSFGAWPSAEGPRRYVRRFPVRLNGDYTTHRWFWGRGFVRFESLHGLRDDDEHPIARRLFRPRDGRRVPQAAAPAHLNLWLYQGRPPSDGRETEIVVTGFRWSQLESPDALLARLAAAQGPAEATRLLRQVAANGGLDPAEAWVGRWAAAYAAADPAARRALLQSLGSSLSR